MTKQTFWISAEIRFNSKLSAILEASRTAQ